MLSDALWYSEMAIANNSTSARAHEEHYTQTNTNMSTSTCHADRDGVWNYYMDGVYVHTTCEDMYVPFCTYKITMSQKHFHQHNSQHQQQDLLSTLIPSIIWWGGDEKV